MSSIQESDLQARKSEATHNSVAAVQHGVSIANMILDDVRGRMGLPEAPKPAPLSAEEQYIEQGLDPEQWPVSYYRASVRQTVSDYLDRIGYDYPRDLIFGLIECALSVADRAAIKRNGRAS